MKKLSDKRQDGLTVNRRIDTRVACPAEIHVRLRFLFNRKSWVITKFVDSHSHELSSPDKSITFILNRRIDQRLAEAL